MPILDERGRLFGRVNLVDAFAAAVLVGLMALAYGSWWLLRTPLPVVESVTPNRLEPGVADQRIRVRGRNLRPYLRVDVGTSRASYLYESWDQGYVLVPVLEPGSYDLIFFDNAKEIVRFPSAVTVNALPTVDLLVRFVVRPEVLDAVKRSQTEANLASGNGASGLISFEVIDEAIGTTESLPTAPAELTRAVFKNGRLVIVNGRVRVPAALTGDGWQRADGTSLKAGAAITLSARDYVLHGEILKVDLIQR